MEPFRRHFGKAVVLNRINVDTDQIIPKQFLKRIEREGIGEFLFYNWRNHSDGSPNQRFELNLPEARDASILISGDNFGCGSSREHAVWALQDYGFRAIIAPSFADIFRNNCYQNGLLPVTLSQEEVNELMTIVGLGDTELAIDLEHQWIKGGDLALPFEVDTFHRQCLLNGMDRISMSLQHEQKISAYESARPSWLERKMPG